MQLNPLKTVKHIALIDLMLKCKHITGPMVKFQSIRSVRQDLRITYKAVEQFISKTIVHWAATI